MPDVKMAKRDILEELADVGSIEELRELVGEITDEERRTILEAKVAEPTEADRAALGPDFAQRLVTRVLIRVRADETPLESDDVLLQWQGITLLEWLNKPGRSDDA